MRSSGPAEPEVTFGRIGAARPAAVMVATLMGMAVLSLGGSVAGGSEAGAATGSPASVGSVASVASPASPASVGSVGSVASAGSPTAPVRAADGLPVPTQDPATSNQKADDILDRSEFRRAEPGFFDRALRWLGDGLATVLSGLFVGGVGSALAWVILAVFVGIVVIVAVRFGRTLQPDPTRAGPPLQIEVRRSPIEWRHEAEQFEARGEWKSALRCRYRALVADLVARKVVRDLAGHTTGEYRADVSAALPSAAAEFAGATELFERAWYGDRPTGADENAQFRELADRVVERATSRSRSSVDA